MLAATPRLLLLSPKSSPFSFSHTLSLFLLLSPPLFLHHVVVVVFFFFSLFRSFVPRRDFLSHPLIPPPPLPSPHQLSPTSRLREFVGPRTGSRITAKDATEQRNRRQQQSTNNTGVEEGGRPGSRSRRQRRLLGMPGFLGFFFPPPFFPGFGQVRLKCLLVSG